MGTQAIHDFVRDGRISPEEGANLLQLRRELVAQRERSLLVRNPLAGVLVLLSVFFLGLLGIRRDS